MELSTILIALYGASPPVKPHDVRRAHQLIHFLRAADLPLLASQTDISACLLRGGFTREALLVSSLASGTSLGVCPTHGSGAQCVSLACEGYPPFFHDGLGAAAPPVVWVSAVGTSGHSSCRSPVPIGGVGSRHPSPYRTKICRAVGAWVARHGSVAVSGGAVGCDSEFVAATVRSAGAGWHILPCGIDAYQPPSTVAIVPGTSMCSAWPPHAPFSGYQAMVRNSYVYGSCAATFVFSARCGVGGSWGGAVSALRARRPVIAILGSDTENTDCQNAMRQLCNLGAIPCDLSVGTGRVAGRLPSAERLHEVLQQSLEAALARGSLNTGLFARTA